MHLTYTKIIIAISTLFRRFGLTLFQNDKSAVKCYRAALGPQTKPGILCVRVLVQSSVEFESKLVIVFVVPMEVEVGLMALLVLPISHCGTGVQGGIRIRVELLVVGFIMLVSVLELVLKFVLKLSNKGLYFCWLISKSKDRLGDHTLRLVILSSHKDEEKIC